MEPVEVLWVDSNHLHGWHDKEEHVDVAGCRTVGLLRSEDAAHVEIIQTEGDCQHANAIAIPRPCIVKITRLATP